MNTSTSMVLNASAGGSIDLSFSHFFAGSFEESFADDGSSFASDLSILPSFESFVAGIPDQNVALLSTSRRPDVSFDISLDLVADDDASVDSDTSTYDCGKPTHVTHPQYFPYLSTEPAEIEKALRRAWQTLGMEFRPDMPNSYYLFPVNVERVVEKEKPATAMVKLSSLANKLIGKKPRLNKQDIRVIPKKFLWAREE